MKCSAEQSVAGRTKARKNEGTKERTNERLPRVSLSRESLASLAVGASACSWLYWQAACSSRHRWPKPAQHLAWPSSVLQVQPWPVSDSLVAAALVSAGVAMHASARRRDVAARLRIRRVRALNRHRIWICLCRRATVWPSRCPRCRQPMGPAKVSAS